MDSPPPDFRMLEFLSCETAAPLRLEAWRQVLAHKLLAVDIKPVSDDAPYHADAWLRALPGLRFGWGTIDASLNRRTRQIIAADNDDIFVIVNLEVVMTVTQRGPARTLRAGEAHVPRFADHASYARA